MSLSEERRATLSGMAEGRRGQGKVIRVKGGGKVAALVNAARGASLAVTTGLRTLETSVGEVVSGARQVGKAREAADALEAELNTIRVAAERIRAQLGGLQSPAALESEESPGVPAMDGEGPHGAEKGPRAKNRKARRKACQKSG